MKTLLLILAIAVSAQAQKAHERYDKFTDTTEATSGQLTVWKCGLLAPPCTMSLESFVLKKNGNVIESGLRVSVLNETGWGPNDSVLYVLVNGEKRLEYNPGASKTEAVFGYVRTTLTYNIDADDLRSLLSAKTAEMKMDSKSFKLKDKLKDLQKIVPYLESAGKTAPVIPASYGITLEGTTNLRLA